MRRSNESWPPVMRSGMAGVSSAAYLRLLVGELPPDSGTIERGANVQIAYFDQQREQLDPERSVADSVTVTALDRNGSRFTLNASGMLATCIQHEMDHLHGKVFVEHLSDLKQNRIRAKLKKRQRKAA